MGFSSEDIVEKYCKLLPDFHQYIVPQTQFADFVVEVGHAYKFSSVKGRDDRPAIC